MIYIYIYIHCLDAVVCVCIHIYIYIYIYTHTYRGLLFPGLVGRPERAGACFGGSHSSNATRVTQVFFSGGEDCSILPCSF